MRKSVFQILLLFFSLQNSFCYIPLKFEPEKDVMFLLRIQNRDFNNEEVLTLNNKENIGKTAFDPSKPTIFHVHGYTEDRRVQHHLIMDKAILDSSDVNLFFVDWGKGSKTFDYSVARNRVNDVSKVIGEFINFINVNPSSICCVGFSLGAHVCGLIQNYLTSGSLKNVFGLDPAGPLFDPQNPSARLNSDSASHVECFFTGYPLGIRAPICKLNFFFNKGFSQPGCGNVYGFDNFGCSHKRAVEYFTEVLNRPKAFYGKMCDSYEDALNGNCNGEPGAFMLDKENSAKNISGIFNVVTNGNMPFGRGKE